MSFLKSHVIQAVEANAIKVNGWIIEIAAVTDVGEPARIFYNCMWKGDVLYSAESILEALEYVGT